MGHGAVAFVFTLEACSFVSRMESHLGTAGKKPPLPEHIQGQDNVWKRGERVVRDEPCKGGREGKLSKPS